MHGLTDSPYSVRAEAERYATRGLLRAGAAHARPRHDPRRADRGEWEDWRAAARLGARHVRGQRAGAAALPPRRLLERRRARRPVRAGRRSSDPALPRPDRIVLMSPMIGVTPLRRRRARIASIVTAVGASPTSRSRVDGRPARVQPVQVQLVPGVRRPADRRDHAGHPGARPSAKPRAGGSSSCRRSSRSSRSSTRPSRPGPPSIALFGRLPDERQRARPLRHQPLGHGDGLPQGHYDERARGAAREARTATTASRS